MRDQPLGRLMVDLQGTSLSPAECKLLQQPAVGAVILFTRNYASVSQIKALIAAIKSLRRPSLLVAVDQEGGRVQRFRHGFYPLPAAADFAPVYAESAATACTLAHYAAAIMAAELRQIGVDFSFAPVLDHANPDSTVLAARSFHADSSAVCRLAAAFVAGMAQAGMRATGKHFPGHGGVIDDSHLQTPSDRRTFDQLAARDLLPFRQLAKQLGGVMTAHVRFEQICPELPTFSTFWLQQILRQQLGFAGMVFSDDLSMLGAASGGDLPQRTRKALKAGCDMALLCNQPDAATQVAEALGNTLPLAPAALHHMRPPPDKDKVLAKQTVQEFKQRLSLVFGEEGDVSG